MCSFSQKHSFDMFILTWFEEVAQWFQFAQTVWLKQFTWRHQESETCEQHFLAMVKMNFEFAWISWVFWVCFGQGCASKEFVKFQYFWVCKGKSFTFLGSEKHWILLHIKWVPSQKVQIFDEDLRICWWNVAIGRIRKWPVLSDSQTCQSFCFLSVVTFILFELASVVSGAHSAAAHAMLVEYKHR